MNIFLIGYRCTGKTTIGGILAGRLRWDFFDTDVELVETAGRTIKDIVRDGGWPAFREMERKTVQAVCAQPNRVVATGGGAILDDGNVSDMKQSGTLIWLKASALTIRQRIVQDESTDANRPSLTGKGSVDEIEETLSKRDPLYENAMDFHIDTDFHSMETIADAILAKLETRVGILELEHRGEYGGKQFRNRF